MHFRRLCTVTGALNYANVSKSKYLLGGEICLVFFGYCGFFCYAVPVKKIPNPQSD